MATSEVTRTGSFPGISSGPPATFGIASRERRLKQGLFISADLLGIWFSSLVALCLRFHGSLIGSSRPNFFANGNKIAGHAGVLLLYSGLIVLFCNTQRLYDGVQKQSSGDEAWAVGKSIGLATLLELGFIYLSGLKFVSRLVIILTMVLSYASCLAWRRIRRRRLSSSVADGWNCRNVLLLGEDDLVWALHDEFSRNRQLGYFVKGVLTPTKAKVRTISGVTQDCLENLRTVARTHFVDEVFVCLRDRELVKSTVAEAHECGLGVHIVPDLYDGLAWGAPVEYWGGFPAISLPRKAKPIVMLMLKRWLDVAVSACILVFTLPALALIAFLIKLDSPGPVIYGSNRIGRKGRTFRCYKFRTMRRDADRLKESLRHLNERDGVLFKITNDPRITRIGRLLRKYSLDEFPQFLNVLVGDMSLVGPRPPLADEVEQYELEHLRRLDVLPGITGLWQVEARCNPSFQSYVSLDVQYVERWSLALDFKILLKTFTVVLAGTGQ